MDPVKKMDSATHLLQCLKESSSLIPPQLSRRGTGRTSRGVRVSFRYFVYLHRAGLNEQSRYEVLDINILCCKTTEEEPGAEL